MRSCDDVTQDLSSGVHIDACLNSLGACLTRCTNRAATAVKQVDRTIFCVVMCEP